MTSEEKLCEIVISEEKLRKVGSIQEAEAKKIFESSTGATVNGKQAKVIRDQNSKTVSVVLGDRPRIIQLTDDKAETVAVLVYDSDSDTLLPKKEQDQKKEQDPIDPYSGIVKAINDGIKEGLHEVAEIIDKKKATR
jgi:hypothetical protein